MPMQPSPIADTSSPLAPSVRRCIVFPIGWNVCVERGPANGWRLPALVLFVAALLHPVHGLAVESLVNGHVRHRGRWCGTVPVFLSRREPDHVAGLDLFNRAAPALGSSAARRDDQRLPERVGVP